MREPLEIRLAKEEERKRKGEIWRAQNPNPLVIAIDQALYIDKLERCIRILPQKPPEKWDEKLLKTVERKAKLICKRVRAFNQRS